MKSRRVALVQIRLAAFVVGSLLAYSAVCGAQVAPSETNPIKLDEYGDLPTDDEAARLDLFAERLFRQPRVRGYIVAYSEPRMERGYYLRRIYGVGRYLTEARGIEDSRILVVDDGQKPRFTTELWLIPEGSDSPSPAPATSQPLLNDMSAYKFDEECLDCSPAVGLYLYGLDEGLKFYAEALHNNPDSRSVIIVRPNEHNSLRKALTEARRAKKLLVERHAIDANRIIVKAARSRNDGTAVAEMWIVPRGAKLPAATSNTASEPPAK